MLRSYLRHLRNCLARIRPIYVVILLTVVALQAALVAVDAFELVYAYSRAHEGYEVDEAFTVFFVLSLALMAVLVVWAKELRREVRRRIKAEADAARLARSDALTGLPNRRTFNEELERRLACARADGGMVALLMLDLDRFKVVNETYGHAAGDRLLQEVADRLGSTLRAEDFLARLGGDEFAVLIDDPLADDAHFRIAQRILSVIARPYVGDDWRAEVTASIGIAVFPGDGDSGALLLKRADAAMYQAKASGRNTHALFNSALDQVMRERLDVETELRDAIRRDEIVPYYQPLIDLATMRPVSLEALARWRHPTRGVLEAHAFVPIAEDAGLIGEIFMAMLRRLCDDGNRWGGTATIAVNVSPTQFDDPGLADRILAVLAEKRFPPARLEIEITESAIVVDVEATRQTIDRLKERGVHIALDDYGTGYSSLRHLRELPFDKVKIDQSFIRRLDTDEESRKIVASTIGLCRALRLVTVAEGIATALEVEWVRAQGGDLGQGYLFSPPVSADAVPQLMAADEPPG